jgi:hypothetical protein
MRWIKHMTQTRRDEKIAALLDKCGYEGYGVYWAVVEIVAEQLKPGDADCSISYSLSGWSRALCLHRCKVRSLLGKLRGSGLVSVELREGKITVTIPNIAKYRDEYTRKSGHCQARVRIKSTSETDSHTETEEEQEQSAGFPVMAMSPASNGRLKNRYAPLSAAPDPTAHDRFESFWGVFPAKDGKKLLKPLALEHFLKLTATEQEQVIIAAQNFANSQRVKQDIGIPDPGRFLLRECPVRCEPWRDWIEPGQRTTKVIVPQKKCGHQLYGDTCEDYAMVGSNYCNRHKATLVAIQKKHGILAEDAR